MTDHVREVRARQLVCTGLGVCLAVGCFSPSGSESSGGTSSETGVSTSAATADSIPTTGSATATTTGVSGSTSVPGETETTIGGDTSTGEPPVGCDGQPFIATEAMLDMILADLNVVPVEGQRYTRYLTLVHLHNAGLCDADIEVHRRALGKLLNSLSRAPMVVAPETIDEERLVFRVDLRDYTWSSNDEMPPSLSEVSFYYPDAAELEKVYESRWDLLVDQNPYRLRYGGEQAKQIEAMTTAVDPILRADALIDAAARPPLYYDALGVPKTLAELEERLLLDLDAALAMERSSDVGHVARAALHMSPLTEVSRALERQDFPGSANRAFWRTFDFVSFFDDVFDEPFDFEFVGSEVLFNLPNGLHAYLIVDNLGVRQNSVPAQVFTDPAQPDSIARAGISCIGCHVAGVKTAEDDLRHEIDMGQNSVDYAPETLMEIARVYVTRGDFAVLLGVDAGRFAIALSNLGLSVEESEPVLTSFQAFAGAVDLDRAAAEFDRPVPELLKQIDQLSADYMVLLEPGGVMSRADFTARFAASACLLGLGATRCCPDGGALTPACGG